MVLRPEAPNAFIRQFFNGRWTPQRAARPPRRAAPRTTQAEIDASTFYSRPPASAHVRAGAPAVTVGQVLIGTTRLWFTQRLRHHLGDPADRDRRGAAGVPAQPGPPAQRGDRVPVAGTRRGLGADPQRGLPASPARPAATTPPRSATGRSASSCAAASPHPPGPRGPGSSSHPRGPTSRSTPTRGRRPARTAGGVLHRHRRASRPARASTRSTGSTVTRPCTRRGCAARPAECRRR